MADKQTKETMAAIARTARGRRVQAAKTKADNAAKDSKKDGGKK